MEAFFRKLLLTTISVAEHEIERSQRQDTLRGLHYFYQGNTRSELASPRRRRYFPPIYNYLPHNLSDPVALVCGSREVMKQTRDRLHEMGFPAERILTNY